MMTTSGSGYTRCPFSYGMFLGTATVVSLILQRRQRQKFTNHEPQVKQQQPKSTKQQDQEPNIRQQPQEQQQLPPSSSSALLPVCEVVFVLGGPGTGKGTQCQLLQERLEGGDRTWVHLSAGDLLRTERQAGGALSDLINTKITAGELVPSDITCQCLEKGMLAAWEEGTSSSPSSTTTTPSTKFLIDGFPRSHENMKAWEDTMSRHTIKFVLNFECPEEVL
jgi:adenylate kinase family enzyme